MKENMIIMSQVHLVLPENYEEVMKLNNISGERFSPKWFNKVGLNVENKGSEYEITGNTNIKVYNIQKVISEDLVQLEAMCRCFNGNMNIGYLIETPKSNNYVLRQLVS